MAEDIVERLRALAASDVDGYDPERALLEAADEIERLRKLQSLLLVSDLMHQFEPEETPLISFPKPAP